MVFINNPNLILIAFSKLTSSKPGSNRRITLIDVAYTFKGILHLAD
jgi:hypothetical protein